MPPMYDVFLSYPRGDEKIELSVELLAKNVGQAIFRLGGRHARLFVDKKINYGDVWPRALEEALQSSHIMLACLAPAYFHSNWCRREWQSFISKERAADQNLIFPVQVVPWDHILKPTKSMQDSKDIHHLIADAESRQMPDITDLLDEGSPALHGLVTAILEAMGPLHDDDDEDSTPPSARVLVRLGTNRAAFEDCLVRASRVTIVGVTHQNLVNFLAQVLQRRAQVNKKPWAEIRIVFLGKPLLRFVYDERSDKNEPDSTTEERTLLADTARRELKRFLETNLGLYPWSIYEYPYLLPFVGAFFEFSDGQKVAQVGSLPPGRTGGEDVLYLEFNSLASPGETAHFESSFERIVAVSRTWDEMLLVGVPRNDQFVVRNFRARRETWQGRGGFIAAIIALLWQRGPDGAAQPLLRVRTSDNSGRELQHLSNLSGFINVHDIGPSGLRRLKGLLPEMALQRAVSREIGEELGLHERFWANPVPAGVARYYFADDIHEHLVFFLYTVEFTSRLEDLPIRASARFEPWSLDGLIELRRQQVLRLAAETLSAGITRNQLNGALDIIRLNLRLHDEDNLARDLAEATASENCKSALVERIKECLKDARRKNPFVYTVGKTDHPILGLAGLQYREFFSKLIPAYAAPHVGIPKAADIASRTKQLATELSVLYQDRQLIRTVGVGLDDLHEVRNS